jgi:rubredoxin-NAD+ reductase
MSVNNLSEYERFRDQLKDKKRIVIIGGGLIGTEFANDLGIGGYLVSVVDLAPQLLGRLLPESIASQLRARLEAIGIQFYLNNSVGEINQSTDGLEVKLLDGQILDADVVLSAVGLRPDLTLANQAGIATNKGIVVNRQLKTNFENIYALGDCAEVNGLVLPYVLPIMAAAKVVAAGLNQQNQELTYPAMPVVVKSPALPLVVSPAPINSRGAWRFIEHHEGTEARFEHDGNLLGFVLAGQATNQRSTLTKLSPNLLG